MSIACRTYDDGDTLQTLFSYPRSVFIHKEPIRHILMIDKSNTLDSREEVDLLVNLVQAEQSEHEHDLLSALTKVTSALAVDPRRVALWVQAGRIFVKMSNWAQAIPALEMALQLKPGLPEAEHLLALALYSTGRQQKACELIDAVCKKRNESALWAMRAYIHSHTSRDPVKALAVHRDWGRRFADPLTRKAPPLVVKDREPRKRLKVGYVTADFREHSVAFFMLPILQHHNSAEVEVHVYSSGRADGVTLLLQKYVPHWHDVMRESDEDLLKRIRRDEIDILVDLSGHTAGHRLLVFARRAAPVQVTWMGYKPPLGMKAMDYRLFDSTADRQQQFYSEKLVKLRCAVSYCPPAYAPISENPPMARNGYITYASLNSSSKVTDEALATWAEILRVVPDSRLLIYVKEDSGEAAQAHMLPRVQQAGLPVDRVFVIAQQPIAHFMETNHIADVMLDTFPVCGGTTTLHAIWMGMPVVTMLGKQDVENSSVKTIRGLGFGGLVSKTREEYVANAVKLSSDLDFLRVCRQTYRDKLSASTLMDYPARAAEVEAAYRQMWVDSLGGNP